MLRSKIHWPNIFISTIRLYSSTIESVEAAYTVYETKHGVTTKPPLLILHALFESSIKWDTIARTINEATGRKVITTDARNHGESPRSPEMSYLHMAQDVIDLIKRLGLQKVSLLGHSMGAKSAMCTALLRSDLISTLIIEDMSPMSNGVNVEFVMGMLDCMASVDFKPDMELSEAKKLADEHLKAVTNDKKLRIYLVNDLMLENGLYSWKTNIEAVKNSFVSEQFIVASKFAGSQYPKPALFIGGALSKHIPKEDFPGIKRLFPNAELTYIDGAKHFVHIDNPEDFMRTLCKFLEDH